jgi:hypothetical protein
MNDSLSFVQFLVLIKLLHYVRCELLWIKIFLEQIADF